MKPEYYKLGECEVFDLLDRYGVSANFNKGNVIKYLLRFPNKNGIQDLEKARIYLERIIKRSVKKNICKSKMPRKTEAILRKLLEGLNITITKKQIVFFIIEYMFLREYKKSLNFLEILIILEQEDLNLSKKER